ncbi:5'-nucleotidase C-terminal domain-containing protein [uncultured Muribaculum sp.]|uniref:bifunctional metallophosphatase/5'-nucleotidase n=2 Tax=uncultured Muribaculum sp. TaxID=1918613 RepID=UPI0025A5731E|nr:5'-nucleotidase C-terminal domain-containing protein [uncultured Muribaculum sp.]
MKRILTLFSALTAVMGLSLNASSMTTIKLLQTSDIHGNFFPYNFITRQPSAGSLARVYGAVKEARQRYGDNVILLDNGDILQGQPTVYYYNFVDTVTPHVASRMMNFMRYDAGNVGNHDVETGRKVLERWSRQCDMPVLGANIIDTATGEPAFTPYKVVEHDGVKVAILGLLTPAIPAWLPEVLWKGLRFDDMEATARKWIPIIKERENPDVIVGVFHAGQRGNTLVRYRENPSLEIAERVPGFDVVLMGHDHRRENKKVVNVEGDTVLVMNPANNGVVLTDITMTFKRDDDGRIIDKHIDGELRHMSDYEPDADFMAEFAPDMAVIKEYVDTPIGEFTSSITTRDAYFGPSEFVDLIHELQLGITGADISFAAPLSYDATIDAGPITVSDMFNLYKYENMLYVMELTGQEVKDYLEEAYSLWCNTMTSASDHLLLFKEEPTEGDESRSTLKNPSYHFDSAAGIIYEVDVRKPKGEKVTIKSMADGKEFDPARTYRVALNSYRGNGGGELLTKGAGIPHDKLTERIVFATDLDLRHYLTDYIKKQGKVNPRKLNQWRFIPEEWTREAAKRDYKILFPR